MFTTLKLTVKNLSAFKNFEGEIGVVIPNSQKGLSRSVIWFNDEEWQVANNDSLGDVLLHHLTEELMDNPDLLTFAKSLDLVEESYQDVIGFINYSLEYN